VPEWLRVAQGKLREAWDGNRETAMTWDTRVNRYFKDGFEFLARFDRVFCSADAQVVLYSLVGDCKVDGGCLSDHYGILVEFQNQ
jgi:endonuclease/exonuclease/phosphatase family metal-dependent hydrolase